MTDHLPPHIAALPDGQLYNVEPERETTSGLMPTFEPWGQPVLTCRHHVSCQQIQDHASWCECSVCIRYVLGRIRRSRANLGPLSAWVEHEVVKSTWITMAELLADKPPAGDTAGPDAGGPRTAP
jgi:hypothetical protein